jgi:sulfide:quinone oxidoreductase
MAKSSFRVLILGAGTGGISVAAKLARSIDASSIAIVDPSENHYYQPMWTIAGAGLADKTSTERFTRDLIPDGVTWLKERVAAVDPVAKTVSLTHGLKVGYDYLVVATGLKLNWDKIDGLEGNLGKNGICSIYEYHQVDQTAAMIQRFQGGTAVFVMPPVPIKCAGAPQKIMYLAENVFRLNGVRHKSKIQFATAGKAMFGIPIFANALEKIAREKDIEPKFLHKIVGVDAEKKEAQFEVTDNEGRVARQSLKYDLLHLVPTMSAHAYVAESGLAFADGDQKGWLEVDKFTLQHLKYPNIFGVGDVTGVPNSKTGAAIRSQYPIVVKNLVSVMNGKPPVEKYNGYSSCPLITEIGKVMLAEFGYDGKLMPTFPLDPSVPRRMMWHLKKDILPTLYWQGMMRGLA